MTRGQIMSAMDQFEVGKSYSFAGWEFKFDWSQGYVAHKNGKVLHDFDSFPNLVHDMAAEGCFE
jgi:hypothetical protein